MRFGVIRNGEILTKPIYTNAIGFVNYAADKGGYDYYFADMSNIGIARKGQKYGVINGSAEEILPFEFDYINEYYVIKGVFLVFLAGKWGGYSLDGKEIIIPIEYDEIISNGGLLYVRQDDTWSYIDLRDGRAYRIDGNALKSHPNYAELRESLKNRKVTQRCKKIYYKIVDSRNAGVYVVRKGRKYGCINKDGDEIIPIIYQKVEFIGDNRLCVKLKNRYGYFDYEGNQLTPISYWYADYFMSKRAIVGINGEDKTRYYGFIDINGKQITSQKYNDIENFYEQRAMVSIGCKSGFIDINGDEVIPIKYDTAASFVHGRARVEIDYKWGFIDVGGTEITPLKYTSLQDFISDVAVYEIDGMYGLVNYDGIEITKPIYNNVSIFGTHGAISMIDGKGCYAGDEYCVVELNDKLGLCTKYGEELTPIIYDYGEF
ncbi:MAG: WG repeat-containing protein [Rikenellaceae bacterium]